MPMQPQAMPIEAALARIAAIRQAMADPSRLVGAGGVTGGTQAPSNAANALAASSSSPSFASALARAGAYTPAASGVALDAAGTTPGVAGSVGPAGSYGLTGVSGVSPLPTSDAGAGGQIVAIAEGQLGQAEQPPGSNEGPAIAQYRTATAGAAPGEPWCAYFASWVARQAGEPIGAGGQGLGSVSAIWSWAQSTGRAVATGPGVAPKPGDLIVFGGEHVGIVRDVLANGQIQTIEGNYENKVSANVRSAGEATGYVSMS
jgi:hypothetical protein